MPLLSGLPEDIARFLTSSSHYNTTAVRPVAFLPNPNNGETSVFRHGAEPLDELKAIAQKELGQERKIHGAAIVKAEVICKAGVDVKAKERPQDMRISSAGHGRKRIGRSARRNKRKLQRLLHSGQVSDCCSPPKNHARQATCEPRIARASHALTEKMPILRSPMCQIATGASPPVAVVSCHQAIPHSRCIGGGGN